MVYHRPSHVSLTDFNMKDHLMADSHDLFDIIHTTRAMRRLKPDPVPDELIRKILQAGVSAANGANRQTWRFMVIKDRAIKERVQHFYKRAFDEVIGPRYQNSAPPPGGSAEKSRRSFRDQYSTCKSAGDCAACSRQYSRCCCLKQATRNRVAGTCCCTSCMVRN